MGIKGDWGTGEIWGEQRVAVGNISFHLSKRNLGFYYFFDFTVSHIDIHDMFYII
jgi:hypothetical protein